MVNTELKTEKKESVDQEKDLLKLSTLSLLVLIMLTLLYSGCDVSPSDDINYGSNNSQVLNTDQAF